MRVLDLVYQSTVEIHEAKAAASKRRAKTLIDGMIKSLIKKGRTHDEAVADLKRQVDSRFYEAIDALAGDDILEENLRDWFKQKWVRFGPDGKIKGACARGSSKEGKPKCLPQAKAHAMGKKKRATAARRKRREDPNPNRKGAAKNVRTEAAENQEPKRYMVIYGKPGQDGKFFRGTKMAANEQEIVDFCTRKGLIYFRSKLADTDEAITEKWSKKYKRSIDCSHPKGFSQKAHCAGRRKRAKEDIEQGERSPHCGGLMYEAVDDDFVVVDGKRIGAVWQDADGSWQSESAVTGMSWEGDDREDMVNHLIEIYKQSKREPSRSKRKEYMDNIASYNSETGIGEHVEESCPHCGGLMYEASRMDEKKDACYYKVKSRYKVWPSAYASGALVQCRKKGAKNWGKKS